VRLKLKPVPAIEPCTVTNIDSIAFRAFENIRVPNCNEHQLVPLGRWLENQWIRSWMLSNGLN
jgi:hypothetical protein